jgi:Zn-dependent alcohol dehydrogenase
MPTPARVAVLPKQAGQLRIEQVDLPDPGPSQVLIKQVASGICHTQLHQLHAPRIAPTLLGHEASGVVMATGSKVSHVREGNKVAVTWLPRDARNCEGPPGISTLALEDGSLAISSDVFTWADHTLVDEQFVVQLPEHADLELASVIGCAVMTGVGAVLHSAEVSAGESVAVIGAGGVGLCAIAAARVAGAYPIIAVDIAAEKLQLARSFGASETIDASQENAVAAIHRLTARGESFTILRQPVSGVDYAFDCVGSAATLAQALAAARSGGFGARVGGTAVAVAAQSLEVSVNPIDLLVNEKRLIGSLGGSSRPQRDLPSLLEWHEQGKLDLSALVSRRCSLDELPEVLEALEAGEIAGRAIVCFDHSA